MSRQTPLILLNNCFTMHDKFRDVNNPKSILVDASYTVFYHHNFRSRDTYI